MVAQRSRHLAFASGLVEHSTAQRAAAASNGCFNRINGNTTPPGPSKIHAALAPAPLAPGHGGTGSTAAAAACLCDPTEVVTSLVTRDAASTGMTAARAQALWIRHQQQVLLDAGDLPLHVVNYSRWFDAPETQNQGAPSVLPPPSQQPPSTRRRPQVHLFRLPAQHKTPTRTSAQHAGETLASATGTGRRHWFG